MTKITYPTFNLQQPGNAGMNVEQVLQQAIGLHRAGQLPQAEKNYQLVLQAQPRNAYALNMLGVLNAQKGERKEGERLLRKAIKTDPDVADYHSNLGQCLQEQEKHEEAESAFKKALKIDPEFIPALFGLANVSLQLKKPEQAIKYYKRTIEKEPRHLPACNNLGNLYRELEQYDEALKIFKKIIELKPDIAEAWYNIGLVYLAQQQGEQATEAFQKAIDMKPGFFRAHLKLGDSQLVRGDLQSAIQEYDHTMEINPHFIPAYFHKSDAYRSYGKFEQAEKTLRDALETDASAIDVYLRLAQSNANEADVEKIQSALGSMDLDLDQLIDTHFTLGKIYENKKEYETAFQHFKQGNDYQHRIAQYDAEEYNYFISDQINTFTSGFIENHSHLGLETQMPLFIVGMPRSGTTLTEQILASHPQVHGAGETEYIKYIAGRFRELLNEKTGLEQQDIRQISSDYLEFINQFAPEARRVTEKMPGNYEQLGLIAMLFPHARIIHCRRNPLDTCMSIYTRHFSSQHSYANNLTDLGIHYRSYLRLMEHWQQVLGDRILHVQYEELVNDLEGVSRKLLEHADLEWDARVLQFHETERAVKTMSQWQVRQRLYTDSIGHWQYYQPWIEPLIESLGDCVSGKIQG